VDTDHSRVGQFRQRLQDERGAVVVANPAELQILPCPDRTCR
jgi:hypothetical protein